MTSSHTKLIVQSAKDLPHKITGKRKKQRRIKVKKREREANLIIAIVIGNILEREVEKTYQLNSKSPGNLEENRAGTRNTIEFEQECSRRR